MEDLLQNEAQLEPTAPVEPALPTLTLAQPVERWRATLKALRRLSRGALPHEYQDLRELDEAISDTIARAE